MSNSFKNHFHLIPIEAQILQSHETERERWISKDYRIESFIQEIPTENE